MKKPYFVLYVLCFVCLLVACRREMVATVSYIGTENDIITVRSTGYDRYQYNAVRDAEKRAFEQLLYRGIAGSHQNLPMISEEQRRIWRGTPTYLNSLFDSGDYKQFINSFQQEYQSKAPQRVAGEGLNHVATVVVGINVPSLRRALEANNVIRKFGY